MASPNVLVVGATGKQGGSVVRALQQLPSPPNIRALSRNPNSPAALKLKEEGIEVFKGSLTDQTSLEKALQGVSSAFLVTTIPDSKEPAEDIQGKTFIAAAKATSLPFMVYTSVSDATPTCGVPHFETKAKVELALQESGIPNTVVAPVAFMDNFPLRSGFISMMAMGVFDAALGGKPLQMIAVDDIGYIAARALNKPAQYTGRKIQLAGDNITMEEVRQVYARIENRSVWKAWFPGFFLNVFPHDMRAMFKLFRTTGYSTDIPELRKEFPGLKTFEDWLREKTKRD